VFDNSLTDGSYYYSRGFVLAPSQLELVDEKIPVEQKHFVTPPNGLRLKWLSTSEGDWGVRLEVQKRYKQGGFIGKELSLWCYSEEGLSSEQSPFIYLGDSNGRSGPGGKLLGELLEIPAGKWVRLRLPFASFTRIMENTEDGTFDSHAMNTISIRQGLDDGKPHTLFLDEITVGDGPSGEANAPASPETIAAKGYDRHVDLTWSAVNLSLAGRRKV
jgi:hypothetical protein